MATPVKEFPENPYLEKMFHPDCFVKVKGNYIDFLRDKNRFDRLVEKGVTTLVLHEKWEQGSKLARAVGIYGKTAERNR